MNFKVSYIFLILSYTLCFNSLSLAGRSTPPLRQPPMAPQFIPMKPQGAPTPRQPELENCEKQAKSPPETPIQTLSSDVETIHKLASAETKGSPCHSEEMELSEPRRSLSHLLPSRLSDEERFTSQLTTFIRSQLSPSVQCFNKIKFSQIKSLAQEIKKLGWHELKLKHFLNIIEFIHRNYDTWTNIVASDNRPHLFTEKHDDGRGAIFRVDYLLKPDGKLLIRIKNKALGKGTYKRAEAAFSIKHGIKTPTFKSKVILTPIMESNEITHELETYNLIKKYRETLPRDILFDGLATAKEIELPPVRSHLPPTQAIIQKYFESNLEKYELKTHSETRPHYLSRIALGLTHLHTMGLVHGDLKENNILISPETREIGISDFGMTYNPKIRIPNRTTATHEAPEMVNAENSPVSTDEQVRQIQKRDVYGLGIIILNAMDLGNLSPYSKCSLHSRNNKGEFEYIPDLAFNQSTRENWGKYGECIKEESNKLHLKLNILATEKCHTERDHCLHAILADALDPQPHTRPSALDIARRLGVDVSALFEFRTLQP